jgi:elongator complex protein 1
MPLEVLSHLVARFLSSYEFSTPGEVETLLPHLIHFTEVHRAEGLALQGGLNRFGIELRDVIEEAWRKPSESGADAGTESWATRMQEKEKERLINPIERVEKPELNAVDSRPKWPLGA